MRCTIITAACLGLLAGIATTASAHHDSHLPRSLDSNIKVRDIYPDLYRSEVADRHPNWNDLEQAARTRWMRQHRCDPRTLTRRYELGVWAWRLVELRWDCTGVPASEQAFLDCIAGHEGGHGNPAVWYGGSTGWQGGRFAGTDRVVNYFQTRPYWASVAHPEVTDRVVTWETFTILTNPVHAADIAASLAPSNYATQGMC